MTVIRDFKANDGSGLNQIFIILDLFSEQNIIKT